MRWNEFRKCQPQPKLLLFVSSILCGGMGIASTGAVNAIAQTATTPNNSAPASGVEEIVVTAERRSDSVRNVPMSITAISGTTLKKFDIQNLSDYAQLTPNISFGMGTGGGGANFGQGVTASLGISIRGISGYDTTAFYIDDTPVPESLDPRILDIDHIEVLRGPQGTLFGASSMGGMVRVITQPASLDTFSGAVEAQGYGMSHGGAPGGETTAVVNLPLVNNLASVRVSAFDSYTPGFFKRTYDDPLALNATGETVTGPAHVVDNVGAQSQAGFGATFRVTPIEGLVLTPVFKWQETTGDGFALADYDPNNLTQRRILDQPEKSRDEFFFAAFTGSYTTPFGRFVSSTSLLKRESFDLEDSADANSLALSPTLLLPGPATGQLHNTVFTEEDRFESAFNFPIQFVGGIFYQKTDTGYVNNVVMPGLDAEPNSPFNTNSVFYLDASNRTTQLAGFIGLTYTPIEPLVIELGGRESYLTNSNYSLSSGIFGIGAGQSNVSESAFTPRFSAKYKFTPDALVYVTAAQGFRIGGANVPIGSECTGFGFSTTAQIPYGSDNLWSYEGGVKASGFGNRLSMSADVYHIDWSKIQQTELLVNPATGCYSALTLNLGSAQSDGAEFEINTRLTDRLSVHVAGGYEDARLTKVTPGTEYSVGEPLSGVPKWTASASADYEIPEDWGSYFIRGKYSFTGQSVSYTELPSGLQRKAYELADLRTGANYQAYTFTLFVKNLFDARPNLSDEVPVGALAADRYRFAVGLPREIGLDFRYHF
jgi:iron complex outermembrane recepter protein